MHQQQFITARWRHVLYKKHLFGCGGDRKDDFILNSNKVKSNEDNKKWKIKEYVMKSNSIWPQGAHRYAQNYISNADWAAASSSWNNLPMDETFCLCFWCKSSSLAAGVWPGATSRKHESSKMAVGAVTVRFFCPNENVQLFNQTALWSRERVGKHLLFITSTQMPLKSLKKEEN